MNETLNQARFAVFEPLEPLWVSRFGTRLLLAVRHEESRHQICFRFRTKPEARAHESTILDWIMRRTPLAYVRGAKESALVDLDSLFDRLTV